MNSVSTTSRCTRAYSGHDQDTHYRCEQGPWLRDRQVAAGHEVWIGARDTRLGQEAARSLDARFIQIDVTDDASVEAAAALVAKTGGLDVLVNNAGISDRTPVADTAASDVLRVLETNVLGPVRVIRAFTSILDASTSPVVVNVSSGVGSLTYASDPKGPYSDLNLLAYPASKAALNMLTIQWAKAHPRWRVNSADPGFTATDLNQHRGVQTVEEGTDEIVRLAAVGFDGPTGTFSDRNSVLPW